MDKNHRMDVSILSMTLMLLNAGGCRAELTSSQEMLWTYTSPPGSPACNVHVSQAEFLQENMTRTERYSVALTGTRILGVTANRARGNASLCVLHPGLAPRLCRTLSQGQHDAVSLVCAQGLYRTKVPEPDVQCAREDQQHVSMTIGICKMTWHDVIHSAYLFRPQTLQIFEVVFPGVPENYTTVLNETYTVRFAMGVSTIYNTDRFINTLASFPSESFSNLESIQLNDVNMSDFKREDFGRLGQHPVISFMAISSDLQVVPKVTYRKSVTARFLTDRELYTEGVSAPLFDREGNPIEKGVLKRIHVEVGNALLPNNASQRHGIHELNGRKLILNNNRITAIPDDPELLLVDGLLISHNRINSSTLHTLQNVRNVSFIVLDYNQIGYIPPETFDGFRNLKMLSLGGANITNIDDVTWKGIGNMGILNLARNPLQQINLTNLITKLPSLQGLNIGNTSLSSIYIGNHTNRTNLKYLNLAGNNFTSFPRELLLTGIDCLDFKVNHMTTEGLSTLLGLKNEFISPRSLRRGSINLLFNCIEFIPLYTPEDVVGLDKVLNWYNIYLHHNPLHCGCVEFKRWLQGKGVRNYQHVLCEDSNLWMTATAVSNLSQSAPLSRCGPLRHTHPYICSHQHSWKVTMVTIVLAMCSIVLIVVLILTARRFHFHLRRWVYLITRGAIGQLDHGLRHEDDFDALIVYADSDFKFVRTLLSRLEQKSVGYRVCINDRDFIIGEDMGKNIMDFMSVSRTVIMVLSPNFEQSEWCGFSINAAFQEGQMRQQPYYIIPVLAGSVKLGLFSKKQIEFLRTLPSVKYEDKSLMEKLKFALGKPMTSLQKSGVKISNYHKMHI